MEQTRCMSVQLNANEYIPTQRENIKIEINKILDDFMIPLMNYTIVTEIKLMAAAANIPKEFAQGVKFLRTAPNKGKIINTWGSDKVPLARYFNYGTTKHWIAPVNAKALAWGGKSGSHATAIFFQGGQPEGTKFSKGHYVSGVPRTEAMEIGFRIGKKRLAEEAGKLIQKELNYVI